MAIADWSTTAADNDDADAAINWLEGQAPSTVNNSARAMMAALKTWYLTVPRVLTRDTTTHAVDTTATETTAFTYTVPANTFSTNYGLRVLVYGDHRNESGGSNLLTVKVKLDGTLVATLKNSEIIANGTTRTTTAKWGEVFIQALGATNSQVSLIEDNIGIAGIATTKDTTAAKDITITIDHSVSDATTDARLRYVLVEIV